MADIQSAAAEIRRGKKKKEEERTTESASSTGLLVEGALLFMPAVTPVPVTTYNIKNLFRITSKI